jgi:LAO/AO transport system kinase
MKLLDEALLGSKRSLGRIISQVENRIPGYREILKEVYDKSKDVFSIGITGPPGSGKSTLIGELAENLLEKGYHLGVVAIDPTSPLSGGAFLGDRIRFMRLTGKDGIYIRSMATRGCVGGGNIALNDTIRILGAVGYEFVIIETVGTGQNEVDIGMIADLVILVMVPDAGDEIQLMKAGGNDIADIFLVNKADHEGADILISRLHDLQQMKKSKAKILKTVATEGKGINELVNYLLKQYTFFDKDGQWIARRKGRIRWEISHLIEHEISDSVRKILGRNSIFLDLLTQKVLSEAISPYPFVEQLSREILSQFENQLKDCLKGLNR